MQSDLYADRAARKSQQRRGGEDRGRGGGDQQDKAGLVAWDGPQGGAQDANFASQAAEGDDVRAVEVALVQSDGVE